MKKLLSIFALLIAASMLIWFVGCGGDDDDDDDDVDAPILQSTAPAAGGSQAANANVTFTYNEGIASATVTGAAGTVAVSGANVIFTPTGLSPGPVNLTCVAKDAAGNATAGDALSFTATAVDTTPPALVGASCDPKDGATGVDPADYPEKIVLKFSEPLGAAKVTKKDPDFKSTDKLEGDTLTMTFLQYSMPNETEFAITVSATDPAGNSADLEYSFVTMEKEQ